MLLVLLVACTKKEPTPASMTWSSCGTLDCATLPVADGAYQLAVTRAPALDAAHRLGVIVFNMGGPGLAFADSLGDFAAQVQTLTPDVRNDFDLVTFDPRGIGASSPLIACAGGDVTALRTTPWSATTDAERAARQASISAFEASCDQTPTDLLQHSGTMDAVDDLEQLRVALGEDELNFVGVSYGTMLGAQYVEAHPDHVRAVVLDSVVGGPTDPQAAWTAAADAQEDVLGELFTECYAAGPGQCALVHPADYGAGPAAVAARFDAFAAQVAALPLAADPPVSIDEFLLATQSALVVPAWWPPYAEALASAIDGDGTSLSQGTGDYWAEGTNAFDAFEVVTAEDSDRTAVTPDLVDGWVAGARASAPRMAAAGLGFSLAGAPWPYAPLRPLPASTATTAPPALVIGGRHDPAALYDNAPALVQAFANGSYLVTYEGYGHGSLWRLSPCTTADAEAFLLDPTKPPATTDCPPS